MEYQSGDHGFDMVEGHSSGHGLDLVGRQSSGRGFNTTQLNVSLHLYVVHVYHML